MSHYIPIIGSLDRIPTQLGGLTYLDAEQYDDERYGVKLRYERGFIKADIYLYDLGRDTVPEDIQSDEVTEVFWDLHDAIVQFGENDSYLDLEVLTSQVLQLFDDQPEPKYLWSAFRYRQAAGEFTEYEGIRYSHLLLRTDAGFFNKIRFTYPESCSDQGEDEMDEFLLEWAEFLQELQL